MVYLKQLKGLYLGGCTSLSHASIKGFRYNNCIKHLDLSYCQQFSDSSMRYMARTFPYVSVLDLQGLCLTTRGVKHLLKMKQLTWLNVSSNLALRDYSLLKAISQMYALESLSLYQCEYISDAGIASLTGLTKLVTLGLGGCVRLTDKSLQYISQMSTLTHLDLWHCYHISNKGIDYIKRMPNLNSINLMHCHQVTNINVLSHIPEVFTLKEEREGPPRSLFDVLSDFKF